MILYKYFKNREIRDLWLEGNGKIYFSPIKYFQTVKDEARKDELENTILFKGPQKIQINQDIINAENIRISNDIIGNYIGCFSTALKQELKEKLGNFILCFDATNFLNFVDSIKMEGISFHHGKINYLSEDQITVSSPFVKRKMFKPESEYRILMKIPNIQTIQNLEIEKKDHFSLSFEISLKKYFSLL